MKMRTGSQSRKHERGISLLETLIAATVMLIGIAGVMSLFTVAAMKNTSQGTQATRCTEYAQDKMEQLMALPFSDLTSDVTVTPTCSTASGCVPSVTYGKGVTPGGTTYPSNFTIGYVDYVTEGTGAGTAIFPTKQSSSAYIRQWSIVLTTNPNVETITVTVASLRTVDAGLTPTTALVSQKANF